MNQTLQELQTIIERSGMHPKAQAYFLRVYNKASFANRESILNFFRVYPEHIPMFCAFFKMKEMAARENKKDQWRSLLRIEEAILNFFAQRVEFQQARS